MKHENHQPVGAFKVHGGVNLVAQLTPAERERGVITASTGNHGQSIAFAGRLFDVPVTVCVPEDANPVKLENIRGYGATIVPHGRDFDDAREYCEGARRARRSALHPLRRRTAPHRRGGDGDARGARAGARARRDRRSDRRRERRRGRLHRRPGAEAGGAGDRRAVRCGAGCVSILAVALPPQRRDEHLRRRPREQGRLRAASANPVGAPRRLRARRRRRDPGRHDADAADDPQPCRAGRSGAAGSYPEAARRARRRADRSDLQRRQCQPRAAARAPRRRG